MNNLLYSIFGKYDVTLSYLPLQKVTRITYGWWKPTLKVKDGHSYVPKMVFFEYEFQPLCTDVTNEKDAQVARVAWRDFQYINTRDITWRV